jgi:hypothetical protein
VHQRIGTVDGRNSGRLDERLTPEKYGLVSKRCRGSAVPDQRRLPSRASKTAATSRQDGCAESRTRERVHLQVHEQRESRHYGAVAVV